jgi:hypothetical protein
VSDTLHEGVRRYMMISHWNLPGMRTVSDKKSKHTFHVIHFIQKWDDVITMIEDNVVQKKKKFGFASWGNWDKNTDWWCLICKVYNMLVGWKLHSTCLTEVLMLCFTIKFNKNKISVGIQYVFQRTVTICPNNDNTVQFLSCLKYFHGYKNLTHIFEQYVFNI